MFFGVAFYPVVFFRVAFYAAAFFPVAFCPEVDGRTDIPIAYAVLHYVARPRLTSYMLKVCEITEAYQCACARVCCTSSDDLSSLICPLLVVAAVPHTAKNINTCYTTINRNRNADLSATFCWQERQLLANIDRYPKTDMPLILKTVNNCTL